MLIIHSFFNGFFGTSSLSYTEKDNLGSSGCIFDFYELECPLMSVVIEGCSRRCCLFARHSALTKKMFRFTLYNISSHYVSICVQVIHSKSNLSVCLYLDMEPTGQAVHFGQLSPAPLRERVHTADCSSLAASDSRSVGEECRESQGRWPAESWLTWTLMCGSQQTPELQSWRTSVSTLAVWKL